MPKPKKTEAELVSADASTAPAAPAAKKASKPKASSAAMHKHTAKQSAKPLTETVPAVEAAPQVQPQPRAVTHDQIAALAYSYWESRGYQGGSQEEDWLRAEHELRGE
jgi:hypothetical protein